jgi:hypothetical protein
LTWRSIDENNIAADELRDMYRPGDAGWRSNPNQEAAFESACGYFADGGWKDGFDSLQRTFGAWAEDFWRSGAV